MEMQSPPPTSKALALARAHDSHRERLSQCRSRTVEEHSSTTLDFLDEKISKNFQSKMHRKKIVRENLQLAQKLERIEKASEKRKKERLSPYEIEEDLVKKYEKKRQISILKKKNDILSKRMQALKPHYSVDAFAKTRRKEKYILNLRKTDHTREYLAMSRKAYSDTQPATQMKPLKPLGNEAVVQIPPDKSYLPKPPTTTKLLPKLSPAPKSMPSPRETRSKSTSHTMEEANRHNNQEIRQHRVSEPMKLTFSHQNAQNAKETTMIPESARPRLSSIIGLNYHIVYEAKREYCVHSPKDNEKDPLSMSSDIIGNQDDDNASASTNKKKMRCSVSVGAQEPYTILTELEVIVRREGSSKIVAKRCMSISEAALDYGCTEHVAKPEWDDAYDLQETLLNMFQEADDDGNGTLSKDEFQNLLQDTDLGISEAEMLTLLEEVDENNDKNVCYEEFMPVAIDLLQSFKARRFAKRVQAVTEQQIEEAVMVALEEPQKNPKLSAEAALPIFTEADQRRQGTLAKHEFRRCLKHSSLNLTQTEQYMIFKSMPVDAFGRIIFKQYNDIVHRIKHATVKREILIDQASEMEKLLFDLCHQQERTLRQPAEDEDDFIYDGQIPIKMLQSVLSNPKIGLTRLQITSVLSEANQHENLVDYYQFVPLAGTIIDKLRDPALLEAKTQVLAKNLRGATDKANTKHESDLARELHELFDQHDTDNSAGLNPTEFGLCMESLELGLTKVNIDALMVQADADQNGIVDRSEFMDFTLNNLVGLIKERRLTLLRKDFEAIARGGHVDAAHFDVPEDVFESIQSPQWDNHTADAHREMIALFRKADANKEGCLNSSEFHRVLDACNLGISSYQKARLMAEADENEDGYITYSEFVPVVSIFLQTFRAKKTALASWNARIIAIDDEVRHKCSQAKTHLIEAVHIIEHAFQEAGKIQASLLFASAAKETKATMSNKKGELTRNKSGRFAENSPADRAGSVFMRRLQAHQMEREELERTSISAVNEHTIEAGRASVDSRDDLNRQSSDSLDYGNHVNGRSVPQAKGRHRYSVSSRRQSLAPSSNFPRLQRQSFLRCLSVPHAKISQAMIDGIASRMPPSKVDGLTATTRFSDVVFQVNRELIRHEVVESLPSNSTLEMHIRALFREKEKQVRRRLASKSSSSPQGQEPQALGLIPTIEAHQALLKAKHLRLSRQQLLCIMSIADDCEASEDAVNADPIFAHLYYEEVATTDKAKSNKMLHTAKFANVAAYMIGDMFDVEKLHHRNHLYRTVKTHSANLLRGDRQKTLIIVLADLFAKRELGLSAHSNHQWFEPHNTNEDRNSYLLKQSRTGVLPLHDFCAVLHSLPLLDLTRAEEAAILSHAPYDDRGSILYDEFLQDAPEIFSLIVEDRQMRTMVNNAAEDDNEYRNADVQVLERQQVTRLCADLVACSSLRLIPNESLLHTNHSGRRHSRRESQRTRRSSRNYSRRESRRESSSNHKNSLAHNNFGMTSPLQHFEIEFNAVNQNETDPQSINRPLRFSTAGLLRRASHNVALYNQMTTSAPCLSLREEYTLPIVDPNDRPLGIDGLPLGFCGTFTETDMPVALTRKALVDIKQIDYHKVKVLVIPLDDTGTSSSNHLTAELRLPSLAAVDEDAGRQFINNIVKHIRIEQISDISRGKGRSTEDESLDNDQSQRQDDRLRLLPRVCSPDNMDDDCFSY